MDRNPSLTPRSRQLRKAPTKEENLLWYNFLLNYPLRFRRQYVISNYILDFYCHSAKLAVELDGSQHYEQPNMDYDNRRTHVLESMGVKVLRFSNLDVLRQFAAVCESIDLEIKSRTNSTEVIP